MKKVWLLTLLGLLFTAAWLQALPVQTSVTVDQVFTSVSADHASPAVNLDLERVSSTMGNPVEVVSDMSISAGLGVLVSDASTVSPQSNGPATTSDVTSNYENGSFFCTLMEPHYDIGNLGGLGGLAPQEVSPLRGKMPALSHGMNVVT